MANVTKTLRGSLASGSNASSYNITITAAAANSLVTCEVMSELAGGATEPTSISCTGITWDGTSTSTQTFVSGTRRVSVWKGTVGGAASGTTVTVTFSANQDGFQGAVFEFANNDTTTPIPAGTLNSGTGTGTSVAASLTGSPATAESLTNLVLGVDDNVTITPEGTWTDSIGSTLTHASPPTGLGSNHKLNDASGNPTTAASESWGWVAYEVQAVVAAVFPPPLTQRRRVR